MPKLIHYAVLLAGVASLSSAEFATSVVSYNPGSGYAIEFGSGIPLTNPNAALGEPSRAIGGAFPSPVDPFNPPYLAEQLLSIGTGGHLVLQFANPILNNPDHPFGLDFIIFGNAGFVITNGNFSGGGITDGNTFGQNEGQTTVSVSADNVTYYNLSPSLAPVVDANFPTDGSGDFSRPVPPGLANSHFSGQDLNGIRALYQGSAGGAAYDISWAINNQGEFINLPAINYIRVDVLGGVSEVDGVAAVPEPSILALAGLGALFLIRRRSIAKAG